MGQDELNNKILEISTNIATLMANSETQAKDIASIRECLDGWGDLQRAKDETLTRHSEKIKTIQADVQRLQNSDGKLMDWAKNTATTFLMMLIGWYYFGR